jgi:hypothetical protein
MKIKELIERLQKENQDDIVVISRDEEGNGFGLLHDIDLAKYKDGGTCPREITPKMREIGFTDEDIFDGGENCVVLWP